MDISPMNKNTFDRIAAVIGKPGQRVYQADVIKAFHPEFKVSQSTVSKWASGDRMSVDKAIWFANKYKVSGWWLLTGEGPMRTDVDDSIALIVEIVDVLSNLDKKAKDEVLGFARFVASRGTDRP